MPSQQPLMRPLRSDSLKPRPSTQASWEPRKPACPSGMPDAAFAVQPKAEIPAIKETIKTERSAQPAELSVPDDKECVSETEEQGDALSAAIASFFSGAEENDDDDEDGSAVHDAVPDRMLPEPVCVPLFDQPEPKRQKRGWLWLVVLAATAGGLYAAWRCGALNVILP